MNVSIFLVQFNCWEKRNSYFFADIICIHFFTSFCKKKIFQWKAVSYQLCCSSFLHFYVYISMQSGKKIIIFFFEIKTKTNVSLMFSNNTKRTIFFFLVIILIIWIYDDLNRDNSFQSKKQNFHRVYIIIFSICVLNIIPLLNIK